MAQKYKFFIKEKSVTFSQDADFGMNDDALEKKWIDAVERMNIEDNATVEFGNLEHFIQRLFSSVNVVVAAGGFVLNQDGQLLMIHRRGYWDLPKGKQESGETLEDTAIREVEEECGVRLLRITSAPYETFHVYQEQSQTFIKRSVWYAMRTNDRAPLVPQTEEDIVEVCWVDRPVSKEFRMGSYASIQEVIDHFG